MNLTQRQLRMFVTTAVTGNVSRASEALHISQPALSRALQELESQLGVPLLVRTTRQVSLTPDGQQFLPVAQRLLRDLEQATSDLREQSRGLTGSVTVALGAAFGCVVMPEVLKAFAATHPRVRVRLVDDNSAGITARVVHAEADLGVCSLIGDTSTLNCQSLLTAPLGLLGDPARFALTRAVRTTDWSSLPLLREPVDTSILHLLRSQGSGLVGQMNQGTEVSSLSLQLALARAGVGVAVVSALGASHPQASGLQFVPLRPAIQREVFLIRRRDRELNPSARAFTTALRDGLRHASLHPAVKPARAKPS